MLYKVWNQKWNEEADNSKKPGRVEEKRFVCFSFIKTQMTEAWLDLESLRELRP